MLVKNEIAWIEEHVRNAAPHLDEMVFFDGNSTDGTLEVLREARDRSPHIVLVENRDPRNLREDYVRLFNEALRTLKTDWAFFLHPDMWIENPEKLAEIKNWDGTAMSVAMESYAGDPGAQLYRIEAGRSKAWKCIYRLHNPDLGAHYYGDYGVHNEDVYFSEITDTDHQFHGKNFENYPYEVADSGLKIHHFSDVRSYERRLKRMETCLLNQGCPPDWAHSAAKSHPRVSLQETDYFKLAPCEDPRRLKVHA